MKLNVLVLYPYYAPAYRAGGIVRSLENLADLLVDDIHFQIVCGDTDLGGKSLHSVDAGTWSAVRGARVLRLRERHPWRAIAKELRSVPADVHYFNAAFRLDYGFWPLLLRAVHATPRAPALVASRGLFSPEALQIKKRRKDLYLRTLVGLGLLNTVSFHASTDTEAEDIRRHIPSARIFVAPDPVRRPIDPGQFIAPSNDHIKIAFVSRISPKKNLIGALRVIAKVPHNVRFTIVGPVDDQHYWDECRRLISSLDKSKEVIVRGYVPPEGVPEILRANDLFLLPTLGENFCHAIYEALAYGLPVLIGLDTPWKDVGATGAGTALEPHDIDGFTSAINEWWEAPDGVKLQSKIAAVRRAERYIAEARLREAHIRLFTQVALSSLST